MSGDQKQDGLRAAPAESLLFLLLSAYTALALAPMPDAIRPAFLTFGAFGILAYACALVLTQAFRHGWVVLLATSFVIAFWAFAFPTSINAVDDNGAYLIFADAFYDRFGETIQPLSERRLFSVGGSYAFQAPFMHWLGLPGLQLVEPTLGLLLFFAVFLSEPRVSKLGALCCIGVIALMPAMGSRVLANTASTFILGSLSFALIAAAFRLSRSSEPSRKDLLLVMALPLAAALYRPTTIPFNVMISAFSILLMLLGGKRVSPRFFGLSAIVVIGVFFIALLPYHAVGNTYLYPLLGRGTHISGTGNFIAAPDNLFGIARNVLHIVSRDPIFILTTLFAAVALFLCERALRPMLGLAVVSYVFFAALLAQATGGLASARYLAPVSFAMTLSALKMLMQNFGHRGSRFDKYLPSAQKAVLLVTILGLLAIRLASQHVADHRLTTHTLSAEAAEAIGHVAQTISDRIGPTQKVLLVELNEGRFLVDRLDRDYLLMDQPGMLQPWRPETEDYSEGLGSFLRANDVAAIVSPRMDCGSTRLEGQPAGWEQFMSYARDLNEAAICGLPGERLSFGGYEVVLLDD